MTTETKITHLNAAKKHLEAVLDTLDLSETECDECGTRTYHNFGEHHLGRKLSGMIQKIDNETSKLRTGKVRGRGHFHAGDDR